MAANFSSQLNEGSSSRTATIPPSRGRAKAGLRHLESATHHCGDCFQRWALRNQEEVRLLRVMISITCTDKLGNPLPESVQKGALKESYVTTVRTVKKALESS